MSKSIRILVRILFCLDLCHMAVWWLNRKYDESWKVFFYDWQAGFVDCEEYAAMLWLTIGLTVLLCIFLLLFIKDSFSFQWRIRVLNKHLVIKWKYRFIFPCLLLLFFLFTGMACKDIYQGWTKYNFWPGSSIVGHSFGAVSDEGNFYSYTGAREAFEENYKKGYRTFEVDLEITGDDKVVLRHDWDQAIQEGISSANIPSQDEFLAVPIMGKYTPLSFQDLCMIMQEYPDIWIVTDSKYSDGENVKKQFNIMVSTAKECGAAEVLDRLVIQIYNEDMYEALQEVYPFKSFIFTLYQRWGGEPEELAGICKWCVEHDVDVITMWHYHWNEEIRAIADRYDRDVYVHTVNDVPAAIDLKENGVKGIYTDMIKPEELEERK